MGLKSLFNTGSGAVKREAANTVEARQGRAANLTSLIDQTFSDPSREAGVQDYMAALRAQLADVTDRGFETSSRRSKFATARQGLTGGRVDVDRQRRGAESLFQSRVGDESAVQDAGLQMRTQDQNTRQSLLNSAYGAADVGQDAMRNMIGQQANIAKYRSTLLPKTFQDVGGAWAGAYTQKET